MNVTANTEQPSDAPGPKLNLGDCVQLISGGPSMAVEYHRADGFTGCCWFHDGEIERDAFPTAALRLAPSLRVVAGRGGSGGSAA